MEVNVISPEERAKVEGKSYLRSRLAGFNVTTESPVQHARRTKFYCSRKLSAAGRTGASFLHFHGLRVPLSLEPKRTLSRIHHFQLSRWASQVLPVADILNSPCVLKTSKKQFLNFCRAKTVHPVESSKLISQAVSEHQSA